MLKREKIKIMIGFGLFILFLSACTKTNPAEEIYNHLENAVLLEKVFEEQQAPLSKAETDEYELYEQILTLSNIEEIVERASNAIEIANTRNEMIEKEKISIEEAYNEFIQVIPIVEKLENSDLKNLANDLINAMENRYHTYLDLYEEYVKAIELDIKLYELIQKEDLTIEQLENQHELVNESYQMVNEFKEKFNQHTSKYNDLKRDFYKLAEVEVVYK